MVKIKTPADFIEAKGNATAFAQAIGAEASKVRMWKHRNRIPRDAWPEILTAFPDVSIETLKKLEAAGT